MTVYLPNFYIDEVGIRPALISTALLIGRLWDLFNDPAIGLLVDRTDTRFGRHRPWVAWSAPLITAVGAYLFFPPEGAGFTYFLTWVLITYTAFSLFGVPHVAWGVAIAPKYDQRSNLYGYREVATLLGMLLVLTIPAILESMGGSRRDGIEAMGYFICATAVICTLMCCVFVPDPPAIERKEQIRMRAVAKNLWKNAIFRRVIGIEFLISVGIGVSGSLYIPMMIHYAKLGAFASQTLLLYFLISMLALPGWLWIARKYTKHQSLGYSLIYAAVTLSGCGIALYFIPGNIGIAIAGVCIYGVAYAVPPALNRALVADVVDHDDAQQGTSNSGLVNSLAFAASKAGMAIGVSGSFYLLDFFFDYRGQNVSESAANGLLFLWTVMPTLAFIGALILALSWPLSRDAHDALREQLRARNG